MTRPNVYSLGRDFNDEELDEIERLANEAVPGPRDNAFLIPARYAVPQLCRQIRGLNATVADLREKAADAKRVATGFSIDDATPPGQVVVIAPGDPLPPYGTTFTVRGKGGPTNG